MFENGRHRIGEPDRQTVLQRGANRVFRTETRPGVHEENLVGQVPQARAQEESLHPGQRRVLNCPSIVDHRSSIYLLSYCKLLSGRNRFPIKNKCI